MAVHAISLIALKIHDSRLQCRYRTKPRGHAASFDANLMRVVTELAKTQDK
jgi:hypothetical protein